jgi:rare lipoprotein A
MKMTMTIALISVLSVLSGTANAIKFETGTIQKGIASYYHDSLHGNLTASGQVYDKNIMSAAHKTLPLGTKVRVTDTKTGKSIVVRVNDRGPFIKGRIIDLSRRAARELGIIQKGITPVKVEVLALPSRDA